MMALSFENLKKSQKRFGIKLKNPDLQKACKELERFFKKEYDKEDLDDCYVCGFLSPEEDMDENLIEECPYCGVEFDYDDEEDDDEIQDEEETEILEGLSPDNLEDDEENEEESDDSTLEEDEEEEEKTSENENNEVEEESSQEENEFVDENTSDLKEVVQRVTEKKEFKVAKKKGSVKKKEETLPVVYEEEALGLTLEQEEKLQESIAKIKNIKTKFVENIYELGMNLTEVHDSMLWKSKSPSFNKFCEDYLDISRSSVYKYMSCTSKFSMEQFKNLGIKKADILSRLPEGKREEVADHVIKNNLTAEEAHSLVKEKKKVPTEKNEKRKQEKEEVNKVKEDTTTILAKVKQDNELEVPWIKFDGEELVEERTDEDKYAIVDISDEVELVIIENEFGTGLICSFRSKK